MESALIHKKYSIKGMFLKRKEVLRDCHLADRTYLFVFLSASFAIMSDKLDMAEIEKSDKSKLKRRNEREKFTAFKKNKTKQLNRRSRKVNRNEACTTNMHCIFHKHCLSLLLAV